MRGWCSVEICRNYHMTEDRTYQQKGRIQAGKGCWPLSIGWELSWYWSNLFKSDKKKQIDTNRSCGQICSNMKQPNRSNNFVQARSKMKHCLIFQTSPFACFSFLNCFFFAFSLLCLLFPFVVVLLVFCCCFYFFPGKKQKKEKQKPKKHKRTNPVFFVFFVFCLSWFLLVFFFCVFWIVLICFLVVPLFFSFFFKFLEFLDLASVWWT